MWIIPALCALLLFGCNSASYTHESFLALGTACTLQVPSSTKTEVMQGAQELADEITAHLSRTAQGSEINTLNLQKQNVLSEDTYNLLKRALDFANKTNGAFDPAIGGLTALWNIGTDQARVPSDAEIAAVDTDWTKVVMEDESRLVTLPEAVQIDLGAIGKGYAADKLKDYLHSQGIDRGIINLGGNIYAIGSKTKDTPWKIGLRDPFKEEGSVFIVLEVSDVSLVTSGTYERFFIQDGVKYHHILDRRSGYPAESDLASVTIIGPESTVCDALSTSVFVLGREAGLKLLESFPGYSCVLVDQDKQVVFSPDFPYPYTLV